MAGPEVDEPMQVGNGKPGSFGGIVAAWAGSITLHAGVILGLHWLASSLAPAPDSPSVLRVTVIESVSATPPEIQSSQTIGSAVSRTGMSPPLRTTPLTPPVVVSQAREITTVPATAVEARPAPRLRKQSVLPAKEPRRSIVATGRVQSVETDVALRHSPPAATPRTRPAPRASATEDRGVRTIARADSHHSTEIRRGTPPRVVQADTGKIGVHMLEQTPPQVRAAHLAQSVLPKLVDGGGAGTRTVKIVRPKAARRVSRTATELASPPVRQRLTGGTVESIADYGWLAQAVHRRIAELKRYPQVARLNQWEGRVVLRAVIRDDGELAALSVRASSGHHELDEAAMKLVRQVCPVPLTHPLGRPEITMHIPITYALER